MEVNQLVFAHIVKQKNLLVNLDIGTWAMLSKQLEISRGVKIAEADTKKNNSLLQDVGGFNLPLTLLMTAF